MSPANRIVHIVDDDSAMRASLAWLFDSRGLATSVYPSAEAFLERFDADRDGVVGCLVLDIRMEGMTGIDLQNRMIAAGIQLPIIFLTGHGNVPTAVSALRKGAVDFIEKPFDGNALVDRVIECLEEEVRRVELRSRHASVKEKLADLTQRDVEVLQRVLAGKYNKVIADELGISMRTVEVHRSTILRKMGVRNAIELARLLADADSHASS